MSIISRDEYGLECNECGAEFWNGDENADDVRDNAAIRGWTYNGIDLCPACAEKEGI